MTTEWWLAAAVGVVVASGLARTALAIGTTSWLRRRSQDYATALRDMVDPDLGPAARESARSRARLLAVGRYRAQQGALTLSVVQLLAAAAGAIVSGALGWYGPAIGLSIVVALDVVLAILAVRALDAARPPVVVRLRRVDLDRIISTEPLDARELGPMVVAARRGILG
ncbi:hypothetical protein [Gordonia malaquae]|uniref:hypothetical protein n=1 Tax=Gordonia malaquae TaxID=410332 RepID=UPI00301B4D15